MYYVLRQELDEEDVNDAANIAMPMPMPMQHSM